MNLLNKFIDLIPKNDKPKLPVRVFTMIFRYFLNHYEFKGFLDFL